MPKSQHPLADGRSPGGRPLAAKSLTEGQRAYEAKRAAKAGMSLDKWLAEKDRATAAAVKAEARTRKAEAKTAKPPGFFKRLLEKAHKPL